MVESVDWREHAVCRLDELDDTGAKGFLVGEGDWPFRGFVVRQDDTVVAYANVCPHARHPLDMFPDAFLVQDGSLIRCGSHGALFKPDTGECVAGPCVGASLLRLNVRCDDDGVVFVRTPESMRDETLSGWTGL
ncbi:MAG: Rieske (2Fe-2S) protein [Gammaproteobacteria bacterium]|nr:Rieske (2Fe-2S) protein [Gammaproteobacteria bacterium]